MTIYFEDIGDWTKSGSPCKIIFDFENLNLLWAGVAFTKWTSVKNAHIFVLIAALQPKTASNLVIHLGTTMIFIRIL